RDRPVHSPKFDVSRSRVYPNVPFGFFFHANVAATGFGGERAGHVTGLHISRTGVGTNLPGDIAHGKVARAAFEIQSPSQTFNPLIAGTAVRLHGRVSRSCNLVIDGDVMVVDVIDGNCVAALPDGRILLDLADVLLTISAEPAVADVNLPA